MIQKKKQLKRGTGGLIMKEVNDYPFEYWKYKVGDKVKSKNMQKMICPNCGEIGMYGQKELVERTLLFNAEGCVGSTEDVTIKVEVPRCLECGRKIKFKD